MDQPILEHLAALRDRYPIERPIGRGGMATVFLARDVEADWPVALKVLHPELASTIGADRFRREIRVAARLEHPNILGVLDSGELPIGPPGRGPLLWFVMPYVDGETVRERLEREYQLPVAEALRIGVAVTSALEYAHAQGVIHRDIKPENLLLSGDAVLVADFGVARALSEVQDKLTATGIVVGTPAYMSPEQASGERAIDGRADIYALATVLYEMLAGQAPYKGPTPQATLALRFMGPPRPVRAIRSTVPEVVDQAVLRALERDPETRFATAGEFAAALQGRAPAAAESHAPAAGRRGCLAAIVAAAFAAPPRGAGKGRGRLPGPRPRP